VMKKNAEVCSVAGLAPAKEENQFDSGTCTFF